jgi:hypothetical protein
MQTIFSQPDDFLSQFAHLPVDILEHIFTFLPVDSIHRLSAVCHRWHSIIIKCRSQLPKVAITRPLVFNFNHRLTDIYTSPIATNSLDIFDSDLNRRSYPIDRFVDYQRNCIFTQIEINLISVDDNNDERVDELALDQLCVHRLVIKCYCAVPMAIVEQLARNRYIDQLDIILHHHHANEEETIQDLLTPIFAARKQTFRFCTNVVRSSRTQSIPRIIHKVTNDIR